MRYWWGLPEWLRDLFWPSVTPFSESEGKSEQEKQASVAQVDNEHIEGLQVPQDGLASVFEAAKAILRAESDRRASVETRLTTVLGMTSVASAIAFGVLAIALNREGRLSVGAWSGGVAVGLVFYVLLQVVCALLASIRGLSRTGYLPVRVGDLIPLQGEDPAVTGRRVLKKYVATAAQHAEANSQKVEQMAVAHRALQNFVVGVLLLTVWVAVMLATGWGQRGSSEKALLLKLRSDTALIELLRGPAGPPGPRGLAGPQGPAGPPGQASLRSDTSAGQ